MQFLNSPNGDTCWYNEQQKKPFIKEVFVINLDKSKDRLEKFTKQAQQANVVFTRWRAVDGSTVNKNAWLDLGVSIWSLENVTKKRLGEFGCFLSHKSLWTHLSKQPFNDTTAYLILEDDAMFEPLFSQKLLEAMQQLPADWDIFFIGCSDAGFSSKGTVARLKNFSGTYAYIIRARSLAKILPYFFLIGEPVDTTMNRILSIFNIYGMPTPLIKPDYSTKSTIVG